MKQLSTICIIAILILLPQLLSAQEEFNPRKDFYYDEDYFKPYSPYLTVNAGYGINFKTAKPEQNFAADIHFRGKFEYLHFNLGYLVSTDYFFRQGPKIQIYRSPQRSHHFHAGIGTRYALLKNNMGIYAGASLVRGRQALADTAFITRLGPGLYMQMHYHWKPAYDMGFGLALFVNLCEHFSTLGIQLSIMFSGDFKPPAKPTIYH